MASETVKRILAAEAEADKKNADARERAEQIVAEAERNAGLAVQKRLTAAKTEADRIRSENSSRLADYTCKAEEQCGQQISQLRETASQNMDKAVESVISGFFS